MIYDALCTVCGKEHEYVQPMARMYETPLCCGKKTTKVILQAPQVGAMSFGREKAFYLPDGKNGGKGTYIDSGAQYKKYMKQNNKVPAAEAHADAERAKARNAKAFKKKLRSTVIDSYNKLVPP